MKDATLPFEFSAVIKKWTASDPRRMVSSEGLTWRSMVCCGMCVSFIVTRWVDFAGQKIYYRLNQHKPATVSTLILLTMGCCFGSA
jgi:hypothetical protein